MPLSLLRIVCVSIKSRVLFCVYISWCLRHTDSASADSGSTQVRLTPILPEGKVFFLIDGVQHVRPMIVAPYES